MSGSVLAVIVIPVVVGIALAGWLYAVFHADRHPEAGNKNVPPDQAGNKIASGPGRSPGKISAVLAAASRYPAKRHASRDPGQKNR